MPAIPPVVCHLGLVGEVPDLPPEVVLHGDPMLVRAHRRHRARRAHAWTVLGRGGLAEDIVTALARRRHRRPRPGRGARRPVTRATWCEAWGGSPYGVLWQGRNTGRPPARARARRSPGVYVAGAHAAPGAGLPSVGSRRRPLVARGIGAAAQADQAWMLAAPT